LVWTFEVLHSKIIKLTVSIVPWLLDIFWWSKNFDCY
jgi:hypothetical protein